MKKFLLILLLFPAFFGKACAEGPTEQALQIFDTVQMETGLNEEEKSVGGKIGPTGYDVASALSRLWQSFVRKLKEEIRAELGFGIKLLALVFLCAFCVAVCTDEKIRGMIEICGVCAASGLLVGGIDSLVSQTTQAIYRLSDYSKAALPVVYTAAAASGNVSSASIGYARAGLMLDVMMSLSQKTVLPLIYASLSLTVVNVVFPNPMLAAMEKLTKWAAKTLLTAATIAFTACIGISSLITAKFDAAAIKTTRAVISGVLPVVGGMVSDASAAVLSAAGVVLSCAGAFGLITVCVMCAGPFAVLSVKGMIFKAAAAAAESVQSPLLQRLFSGIGGAVSLLMGLLGCNAIMLFLSIASAIKVVMV